MTIITKTLDFYGTKKMLEIYFNEYFFPFPKTLKPPLIKNLFHRVIFSFNEICGISHPSIQIEETVICYWKLYIPFSFVQCTYMQTWHQVVIQYNNNCGEKMIGTKRTGKSAISGFSLFFSFGMSNIIYGENLKLNSRVVLRTHK